MKRFKEGDIVVIEQREYLWRVIAVTDDGYLLREKDAEGWAMFLPPIPATDDELEFAPQEAVYENQG
jgi:hypothetical protein